MKNPLLIWLFLFMASLTVSNAQPTTKDALDEPNLTWTRLGNAFGITTAVATNTHDGVDGFLSGSITDGQKSGVRTSVTGPGTLTFWWKVSSELGFDPFGFWVGPTLVGGNGLHTFQDPETSISGPDQIWEQQTYLIPPGTIFLEWVYIKDDSDSDGADRAYLDEVHFIPDPPTITIQPPEETAVVPVGTNVTFSVDFIEGGFPSVPNQTKLFWQLNGTNLPGKTNATLSLTNLQVNQSGDYQLVITNLYGKSTSEVATLEVYLPYPLDQALDTTNLVWTSTGGDATWFGLADSLESFDGVDVARSGLTPEDFEQLTFTSYLQTTVTGPGVLKFWWRLSGLDTDQFYMSVGGFIKTTNGVFLMPPDDGSWVEETIGVTSGSKVVKFTYLRDDFISTDDTDGAYLDMFRFIPSTNAPPIFSSPALDTNGFSATIQLDPSRGYTIQRSTNLITWTNVVSFTNDDVFYYFVDPSATNVLPASRFYRIKSP